MIGYKIQTHCMTDAVMFHCIDFVTIFPMHSVVFYPTENGNEIVCGFISESGI